MYMRFDDEKQRAAASPDGLAAYPGGALLEVVLLAAVPLAMGLALVAGFAQTALLMLLVVTVVLALFFAGYEAGRPALRQIMPTLVLSALAAIAIIAGATLGRRNGFMVGALAALASNFFFGQGMWSPWQMYAWGMVGYLGGVLASAGVFDNRATGKPRMVTLVTCGLASGALYGVIINAYGVLGFVRPFTWPGALTYVASFTVWRPRCFLRSCMARGRAASTAWRANTACVGRLISCKHRM